MLLSVLIFYLKNKTLSFEASSSKDSTFSSHQECWYTDDLPTCGKVKFRILG